MSISELERFVEDLKAGSVDMKLDDYDSQEALLNAINDAGYDITDRELSEFLTVLQQHQAKEGELSDEELSGVAGGIFSIKGSLGSVVDGVFAVPGAMFNFGRDVGRNV